MTEESNSQLGLRPQAPQAPSAIGTRAAHRCLTRARAQLASLHRAHHAHSGPHVPIQEPHLRRLHGLMLELSMSSEMPLPFSPTILWLIAICNANLRAGRVLRVLDFRDV